MGKEIEKDCPCTRRCKAKVEDSARIKEFYRFVAENTESMDKYGRWIYGLHPTDEMIEAYISEGSMYFAEENGDISAAVAVTSYQGEDYHPVQWKADAKDDEVAVIHLLCVNPKKQGKGLAKAVVKEVIQMARECQMKAVRLDVLCCNTPAQQLYEGLGFERCGVQNWYASNTGDIDFYLYEYLL